MDYSLDSQLTKDFFATVQNKMHYAVHGNTAAEVIMERADHTKEHMGLTSWRNAPDGKIVKADVSIAKNYLSKGEIQELNEIVTMYLNYATRQARRHIPMTMADWASKLDAFLQFNYAEILQNKGKVTAAIAKAFAESEFEQYRIIQDRLYQSDFDRLVASTKENSWQKPKCPLSAITANTGIRLSIYKFSQNDFLRTKVGDKIISHLTVCTAHFLKYRFHKNQLLFVLIFSGCKAFSVSFLYCFPNKCKWAAVTCILVEKPLFTY